MGLHYQPNLVMDGLVIAFDARNSKCYTPGVGSTAVNDISGNQFVHGFFNGAGHSTSVLGGMFVFDGTNYVLLPRTAGNGTTILFNNFTVSVYAKSYNTTATSGESTTGTPGTSGKKYIVEPRYAEISNAGGWGINLGTNAVEVVEHTAGHMPVLLSHSATINGFNHITLVCNNRTPSIYINGILARTGLQSSKGSTTYFLDTGLGGYIYGYTSSYISNYHVYNRVLSSTEILQNYNAYVSRFAYSENIVSSGLTLNLDTGDELSYTTGTAITDLSTGANNGSLVNGPVLVGTGSSASLSFDGVNDNITVAHSSGTAPGNNLTFGVMFKSSSVSGTIVVMGKQAAGSGAGSYAIVIQSNKLHSRISNGSTEYNASMPFSNTSTFNYAVGTYDGSTLKLYHNGLLVDSTSVSISITYSASYPLYIGSYGGTDFPMRGFINSAQLYSRALTANEIKQNFDTFKTRFDLSGTGTTSGVEVPL